MFDYGSYQWNNRYRANLILWGVLVTVGNELKNSFGSLSLRKKQPTRAAFLREREVMRTPGGVIA